MPQPYPASPTLSHASPLPSISHPVPCLNPTQHLPPCGCPMPPSSSHPAPCLYHPAQALHSTFRPCPIPLLSCTNAQTQYLPPQIPYPAPPIPCPTHLPSHTNTYTSPPTPVPYLYNLTQIFYSAPPTPYLYHLTQTFYPEPPTPILHKFHNQHLPSIVPCLYCPTQTPTFLTEMLSRTSTVHLTLIKIKTRQDKDADSLRSHAVPLHTSPNCPAPSLVSKVRVERSISHLSLVSRDKSSMTGCSLGQGLTSRWQRPSELSVQDKSTLVHSLRLLEAMVL